MTVRLPQSIAEYREFTLFYAYRIPEFVPVGTLDFVCWKLFLSTYSPLYRIPGKVGTFLPENVRDSDTFVEGLEPTTLTALQDVRRLPGRHEDEPADQYSAEVFLQCFALDTQLLEQAKAENRLHYLHDIVPLAPEGYEGSQWGEVMYFERYPKPLYEVHYDGRLVALVNADRYELAKDGHRLTLCLDYFSWRVWINNTMVDISEAFTISPPVFTLTAPGTISIRQSHELYIERPPEWPPADDGIETEL